jgi:AcrR family transcriptional regulator
VTRPKSAAPAGYDTNRRRILRISADLFARNGYHGTGVSDLGKAAGLGKGALYHYIGSKESVLYEISMGQVSQMNAYAAEQHDQLADPIELLHALARGLMRNIADHRAEWTVFFREYHALTGDWRDRVVAAREQYEGYWRAAIDKGVRSGALQTQPSLVVKGLLGMFNYSYLWLDPVGGLPPEDVADLFMDAMLHGLVPRPGDPQ